MVYSLGMEPNEVGSASVGGGGGGATNVLLFSFCS